MHNPCSPSYARTPRRSRRVAALAAVLGLPVVASTASAVTVGETFTANAACDGITVVKTVPGSGTSYIVPSDGVLTSWSTSAESGGKRMAAVVYRQVGGNYELVGISDRVVPVGSGVKTYSTNIAVRQGDLFGSWVEMRDGLTNVDRTCEYGGVGYTSAWWYDSPGDVLPPTAVVPISSIGTSLTGNSNDSGWRYNISGEVGPPAPAPDPQAPATPGSSSGSTAPSTSGSASESGAGTTHPPVLRLAGRFTRPSAQGVVRTRGALPAGARRVTQTALRARSTRAAARLGFLEMATGTARTGACAITGAAYRCSILLGPGRWTLTTSALGAAGVVAMSTHGVAVRRITLPDTG